MAVFGHSGSQAPQLMHSEVIIVAMAASRHTFPQAAAQSRDGSAGAAGTPRSRPKGGGHSAPVVVPGRSGVGWVAVPALFAALVGPTRAQFDPAFNNLFCYGMHEQPGQPPFTPVVGDMARQRG